MGQDFEAEIKALEADVKRYRAAGRDDAADDREEKVLLLKKKWEKEKAKVGVHPA